MSEKVIVTCKLPHGIIIEHPTDPTKKVTIKGLNSSEIKGMDGRGIGLVTTEVDADFWAAWESVNKEFPAIKSGALFVAKGFNDAKAKFKELEKEVTGFEPMPQEALGVETAEEKKKGK